MVANDIGYNNVENHNLCRPYVESCGKMYRPGEPWTLPKPVKKSVTLYGIIYTGRLLWFLIFRPVKEEVWKVWTWLRPWLIESESRKKIIRDWMEDSRWDFNKKDIIFHFRKKWNRKAVQMEWKCFICYFFIYLLVKLISKQLVWDAGNYLKILTWIFTWSCTDFAPPIMMRRQK